MQVDMESMPKCGTAKAVMRLYKKQIKRKFPANVNILGETAYPMSGFCQKIIDN